MADDPPTTSAQQLAATLSRRVRDTLATAEAAAAQIRSAAEADARAYDIQARRRVEAFAAERAQRLGAVADRLLQHTEALAERAARAERLEGSIDAVVDALAAAAEAIAAEARRARADAEPADDEDRGAPVTRLAPRPHAVPEPAGDDAGAHVREVARALPRRPGAVPRPPRIVVPVLPPDPPDDAA